MLYLAYVAGCFGLCILGSGSILAWKSLYLVVEGSVPVSLWDYACRDIESNPQNGPLALSLETSVAKRFSLSYSLSNVAPTAINPQLGSSNWVKWTKIELRTDGPTSSMFPGVL
ncbi:hypothetical protein K449DRAFT_437604 [Hypoxylon sp. EC38]|nr:hypothetical protein K449DRAFT_437604 [Hypoxylon sp. EC38]